MNKVWIISKFSDPYEPPMPLGLFSDEKKATEIWDKLVTATKERYLRSFPNSSEKSLEEMIEREYCFESMDIDLEEYLDIKFYMSK